MNATHRLRWAAGLLAALALLASLSLTLLFRAPRLRVVEFVPGDGAYEVPITTPIRLRFSQAMDGPSVESRLHWQPEVAGSWTWTGDDLLFHPTGALAPDVAYALVLDGGARSRSGRTLPQPLEWRFHTRTPELLFLGRADPEADVRQLFATSPGQGQAQQLTDAPLGVWDYAVQPQGQAIVYSRLRDDGGADLWRIDRDGSNARLLLACPARACLAPAWSPDGRTLAYEQRDIWADAPNLDPSAGRIWILDLTTVKDRPLFDYDVPLHSPAWSPDGLSLAYVSPLLPGIEVLDLQSEALQQFGNEWSATPVWSPDGRSLVAPDLLLVDEAMAVRLVRMDLESGQLVDISGDDSLVRDDATAWSPGGGWVAFGRQFLDQERWTPGRQIWLARPDGGESYALLTEPMADHFALTWRPDGAALAYVATDLSADPQPVPAVSVWVYDLPAHAASQIADQAVLPRWLP